MYIQDVQRMVEVSVKKVEYLERSPFDYLILSALAGVYLGFGITLVFCLGVGGILKHAPASGSSLTHRAKGNGKGANLSWIDAIFI